MRLLRPFNLPVSELPQGEPTPRVPAQQKELFIFHMFVSILYTPSRSIPTKRSCWTWTARAATATPPTSHRSPKCARTSCWTRKRKKPNRRPPTRPRKRHQRRPHQPHAPNRARAPNRRRANRANAKRKYIEHKNKHFYIIYDLTLHIAPTQIQQLVQLVLRRQ